MNKCFAAVAAALLLVSSMEDATAYDWQPQTNEELRSGMISFAEGFRQRAKGTPAGRQLRRFVRKQKKLALKSPYAWISQTKDFVLKLESEYAPVVDDASQEALLRRDILLLLDYPLHADNLNPASPEALCSEFEQMSLSYRAQARLRALDALSGPGPAAPGELQVIKIYNCGLILRTSGRCIAVDVKWEGGKAGADAVARASDAFFLSHPHSDHYSPVMMQALCDAGKTAVLPSDVAPKLQWDGKTVIHEDVLEPMDIGGIDMYIVEGAQMKVYPNNSYLLCFDGWRVLLTGENTQASLCSKLGHLDAPDLILTPSWSHFEEIMSIVRQMPSYDPSRTVYIPEHENELNHTVSHRESYRELFSRPDRLGDADAVYPEVVLMDIGEKYTLRHK